MPKKSSWEWVNEEDKLCNFSEYDKNLIRHIIAYLNMDDSNTPELVLTKDHLMNLFDNPSSHAELKKKVKDKFDRFLTKADLFIETESGSMFSEKILKQINFSEQGDLTLSISPKIRDKFIQSMILQYLERDLTEEEKKEILAKKANEMVSSSETHIEIYGETTVPNELLLATYKLSSLAFKIYMLAISYGVDNQKGDFITIRFKTEHLKNTLGVQTIKEIQLASKELKNAYMIDVFFPLYSAQNTGIGKFKLMEDIKCNDKELYCKLHYDLYPYFFTPWGGAW